MDAPRHKQAWSGCGRPGGCCVRERGRTIAIVAEWWSIEVLHGEVSAFRWQEQHDSALIEAALTNGVRDGSWHADRWGVVFEVLFGTEEQWDASAPCLSCGRPWMPSRIRSAACSSTAAAAAGQGSGSRAGRSPRRARLPFRCPGPRANHIWTWRLSPHGLRQTSGRPRRGVTLRGEAKIPVQRFRCSQRRGESRSGRPGMNDQRSLARC